MTEQRRLAAILVADVVGYSTLVGKDEAGTLARLNALRSDVVDPAIGKHAGRLFKSMGDGFLVEFASAVQAVACARAIQDANTGELKLRIGIHLGDVVVQGDDLLGDGVNIAARVEGVAEPGGIAISRQVHDQVRDKLDMKFVDKGQVELKNLVRPVRVFAFGGARQAEAPVLALPDRPSIAVLPFQNMSGDPNKEYFSDGVAEDIITILSKFRELSVISRNSSFAYKAPSADLREIGSRLKCRYVVEGSVRSDGSRVRITAQLTDASTGTSLWAERYDRDLTDIFQVQDEITARIATAVDPAIRDAETKAALRKRPADLGSWDHVLRGLWHFNQFRPEANLHGRREFELAVERDPGSALAQAWLAFTHVCDAWFNWTSSHAASLEAALRAAATAVRLDPQEPMAHAAEAFANFWVRRLEQAQAAADRAVALNPNSFLANYICGGARNYLGQCEAGVSSSLKALDLSPADPLAWNCLGSLAHTYFNLGRFADAVACADRAIVLRHGYLFARVVKTAALAQAGRRDEAAASLRAIFEIAPDFSLARLDHYPFVLDSQRQFLFDGLAKAGLQVARPETSKGAAAAPPLALPDKPSIAVLPFQNMSGDPEQEYFVDGLVEDLTTALSRFKELFVIARNSAFTYKGRAVDIKQVGRELGVRYVLEGSVRRAGGKIRITGQLIDTSTGAHLWADRFDGSLEDIFDLQDRIAASIVGELTVEVATAEFSRARRKPTSDLSAYDHYLRGIDRMYYWTRDGVEAALPFLLKAIALDDGFADAYAQASMCYTLRKQSRWMQDWPGETAEGARLARRAVELGRDDPRALGTGGFSLAYLGEQVEFGAECISLSLAMNPNYAAGWNYSGWVNIYLGRPEIALDHLERGRRLSPRDPSVLQLYTAQALAHYFARRYDETVRLTEMVTRQIPAFLPAWRMAAIAHAMKGDSVQASLAAARVLELDPAARVSILVPLLPMQQVEDREHYRQGLRLAGVPE